MDENTSVAITLTGSDTDGDALTYRVTTQPADGTLSGSPPDVTYTPNVNFNGNDSFVYKITDADGDYDCSIGRMINSGSDDTTNNTGGWTSFSQDNPCNGGTKSWWKNHPRLL